MRYRCRSKCRRRLAGSDSASPQRGDRRPGISLAAAASIQSRHRFECPNKQWKVPQCCWLQVRVLGLFQPSTSTLPGGWILWYEVTTEYPDLQSDMRVEWSLEDAFETKQDCEREGLKMAGLRDVGLKNRAEKGEIHDYLGIVTTKKLFVYETALPRTNRAIRRTERYLCLPSDFDPREKK